MTILLLTEKKMKKGKFRISALLLAVLLVLSSVIFSLPSLADFVSEAGNITAASVGSGSPATIDGVSSTGEIWDHASALVLNDTNMIPAWGASSRVVTTTAVKFAYDSEGIYLFATTFDQSPVRSTGTDTEGDNTLHGWNGDVLIFSLDPLATASTDASYVPWYCFGLDASGNTLIYVSQAGTRNRQVTDGSIVAASQVIDNYVFVEAKIPWSIIAADVRTSPSKLRVTAANISAPGATHNAKIVYMDRYSYGASGQPDYRSLYSGSVSNGTVVTICRSFTPCNTIPGTSTPGTWGSAERANTCGIYINLDSHTHIPGAWQTVTAATCTTNGERVQYCTECGALVSSEVIPAAHTFGQGVVYRAPTPAEDGIMRYTCTVCGTTQDEVIPKTSINLINTGMASTHLTDNSFRVFFSVDADACINSPSVVEVGAIVRKNSTTTNSMTVNTDGTLVNTRGMAKATLFKDNVQVGNIYDTDGNTASFTILLTGLNDLRAKYSFRAYAIYENSNGQRHVEYTAAYSSISYNDIVCLDRGHTYDSGVVTTEPTTTSVGIKTYTCTRCGATYEETLPKIQSNEKLLVTYYDAQNYGPLTSMKTSEIANTDIIYYTGYDIYSVGSTSIDARAKSNMTNKTQIAWAKGINPDLKVIMALYAAPATFNACVASTSVKNMVMTQLVDIMEQVGFDGIDVDWEYPASGGADKDKTTAFFTALRAELDRRAAAKGTQYYLTAAVPQGVWPFSLYDMETMGSVCDYLNVMTYDGHISRQYTQHHTAPRENPNLVFAAFNQSVESTIQIFTANGIPAEKLLMGCGLYSVDWGALPSNTTHGLNVNAGRAYSGQVLVRYNALQDAVNAGYNMYWDDLAKAAYLYNGSIFVSIDNDDSIKEKALICEEYGAGGLMLFCYSTYQGNNTLTTSIRNWLDGDDTYPNAINWTYSN